ncbi:MAG: amidohydrolase [candidate division WS1 bacterium]|jgi:5-methylthioadenosine/S-adenosylhomocysteine deaminase|nr:amidohydrolase [candidate division WS1 bacterium]
MAILRIENAQIITMADGDATLHECWTLEAVDGAITYVGPSEGLQSAAEPDERIDGSDCLLLPGFVNAHTHAAMTLFRGSADDMPLEPWLHEKIWPIEAKLTADDVYWGTLLGCAEMLRAGVTCFNDMYHLPREGTRAAMDCGIRMCPAGVLLGIVPNAEDMFEEALAFTREFARRDDLCIHPMLAPHAPYTVPRELMERVIGAAQEIGVAIHIHLAETADNVATAMKTYGATPIQAMDGIGLFEAKVLGAHCVHLSDRDIEIIAQKHVGVAHCPGSNLKLASGIARTRDLLATGAHVGLGTDGSGSNNNLDLLEEARLAALIAKVSTGDPTAVPAEAALEMATLGGARAIFLDYCVGSLEPGKRCDCILVDLDAPHLQPRHCLSSHMIYSAQASDVKTTIVDGKVLMRDRELLTIDLPETYAKVGESVERLFG